MGKNIHSTRCLFMGKIIRSNIDFLYVKGNRLSAHKLPIIRPPTGTYYLTYNVTLRQLVSGCLVYLYKCIELDTNIYSLYVESKSVVYLYDIPHDINLLNSIMVKITIII